jgi:transposase
MRQLTPRKCALVVHYAEQGRSVRDIASLLKVPRSTVHRCVTRFKQTGSGEIKPRSGRPRVTDRRHDNRMRRLVMVSPSLASQEIKEALDSPASTRTIRRRLVTEFNLRSRRPAKKPLLSALQASKRLMFCKKFSKWTVAQWNKVLLSDESTFCQFGSLVSHVRRLPNTRYLPKNTVPTVKHSPKVMIWGTFSASGRGCLVFVPVGRTVNAQVYLHMLEEKLERTMIISNCTVFQQDSAPCHTAKTVKEWMRSRDITLLDWPGNSPDLNPIENLWQIMKRKVRRHAPKSMLDLQYWIKRVWIQEITPNVCQKLVASMPKRIQTVLKNKGQMSKY